MFTELSDEEMDGVLDREYVGHLGCMSGGEMYIVPTTYARDGSSIVSYTTEGKKIDMMRQHERVCFQVEHVRNVSDWESVICWGMFEEIADEDEAHKAALLLAERFAESQDEGRATVSRLVSDLSKHDGGGRASIVYRINVEKRSGKSQRPT